MRALVAVILQLMHFGGKAATLFTIHDEAGQS
jgi:hypothetical protein